MFQRITAIFVLTSAIFGATEEVCNEGESTCPDVGSHASGRSVLQKHQKTTMVVDIASEEKINATEKVREKTGCSSWCKYDNCNWAVCKDCAMCSGPAPTPAPTSEPTAAPTATPAPTPECKSWCTVDQCTWKTCSACGHCFPPTPVPPGTPAPPGKKNVLIILTDDLNVDVQGWKNGHPQTVTPNIQKLAERGTRFEYAFVQHPVCVPSRASFITGIYGFVTHAMYTDKYWKFTIPENSRTLVEQFAAAGYKTYGTGKIGHKEKPDMFDVWGNDPDYGPVWSNDGETTVAHPALPAEYVKYREDREEVYSGALDLSFGRLSTAKPYISGKAGWYYADTMVQMRYESDDDRDPTPDEMNADWVVEKLGDPTLLAETWFMAVGFTRPHTPLHVADKYFDMFPVESLSLPEIKADDADDTHFKSSLGSSLFNYLVEAYGRDEGLLIHLQAYLASVAAADEQTGKVLDALEANGYMDKTIVVFMSDHGWHTGQKDVVWKNTPWEEALRIPLIIADPTYGAQTVEHPVALIDVFPTLLDLNGVSMDIKLNDQGGDLSGVSLKPLMENPSAELSREGVVSAITNYGNEWNWEKCTPCKNKDEVNYHPLNQDFTVRTKDWRYIWVADGTEELYDHTQDPHEWTNLIGNTDLLPDWKDVRANLRSLINKELEPTGKAFDLTADGTDMCVTPKYR